VGTREVLKAKILLRKARVKAKKMLLKVLKSKEPLLDFLV
jgi:hypothetical protein